LSHRYCYLPLSWKSWNRFECAVGGARHATYATPRTPRHVRHATYATPRTSRHATYATHSTLKPAVRTSDLAFIFCF
jgi:hypothetical protein